MSSLDYLNRVYLRIDLDRICENTKKIIEKVGTATKVMPVVKADAYGHGAIEVTKALSEIGTYGFAVATVGEALALRRAGITKPILILDFVFPNQFETIIRNDIMLTVFQYGIAKSLNEAAKQMGTTAHIHLKVDTGMGRIGYIPNDESIEETKRISELSNIEIDGIFYKKATVMPAMAVSDEFPKFLEGADITHNPDGSWSITTDWGVS
ncbi:MAG: alanine racemase, partial [Clostridia bacterium]|nr:alanine racemase [Clostridia bacterium]